MSTYMYFRCLQHDPPLVHEEEISQHRDEYLEDAIKLAQGMDAIEYHAGTRAGSMFLNNAMHFLRQHRQCPIDVVTEYGEAIPVPGREKAQK